MIPDKSIEQLVKPGLNRTTKLRVRSPLVFARDDCFRSDDSVHAGNLRLEVQEVPFQLLVAEPRVIVGDLDSLGEGNNVLYLL